MTRAWKCLEKGLECCGGLLIVAVSLPLLALALFVLRGVLMVAAVAAVVTTLVLYCAYPRFRHWADQMCRPTKLKVR